MKRRTPLRTKTELRRGGRVRSINPERRAKQYERNYGDRADVVRDMQCLVGRDCNGRVVAAHVKARGMGGCGGDRRSLVPLCWSHHDIQGNVGINTFQETFRLDLHAEADRIAKDLDELGYD